MTLIGCGDDVVMMPFGSPFSNQSRLILHGKLGPVKLTPREHTILLYVLQGKTLSAIAPLLGLSPRTVRNYFNTLKAKLGFRHKKTLLQYALAHQFHQKLGLLG